MKLLIVAAVLFAVGVTIFAEYQENIKYHYNSNNYNKPADHEFLDKQATVLELLSGVYYPYNNQKYVEAAKQYNPDANINNFTNSHFVKRFLKNYHSHNFLPLDQIFSPTNQQHQNQVAQLYYYFYNAQDWYTFKQAAAWARIHFNPGQFVYAFAAAVVNRPDTRGVVIPPFYEVFPEQFIPSQALYQIYHNYAGGCHEANVYANYSGQNKNNYYYHYYYYNSDNENSNNYYNNYYNNPHNAQSFYANDDGSYYNNAGVPENPENKIKYFTEDIGINAFQAGFYTQHPPFFGYNSYYNQNNNRNTNNNNNANQYSYQDKVNGEAFYYANQQFYARYILERLANDLPIPHPINFNSYVEPGYNPNLHYFNGQAVPARPPYTYFQQQHDNNNNNNNNAKIPNNNQAQNPQIYEYRIHKVADTGHVYNSDGSIYQLNNENGVSVLANIIAYPASSINPDYYGDYFSTAKNAIGNIVDPNNQNGVAPGAVSNYATAARDPAYYQFLANIIQIFKNFQNKQGPYTQDHIAFPGVKIENVEVDKLVTYFDNFDVNVNNVFGGYYYNRSYNYNNDNAGYNHHNYNYNIRFQRLNHLPYNYKVTVNSDKQTNAVVRVFIGPKYDSNGQAFTLAQASQYYYQVDQFVTQLKKGSNHFQRNSNQSPIFVGDVPSYNHLRQKVESAHQGSQQFYYSEGESYHCGFPGRYQLPKGKKNGHEYVFYVVVSSNNEDISNYNSNGHYFDSFYCGGYSQNHNHDGRPHGFPFDRPVQESYFNTANQYFKTVQIYHKNHNPSS